MRKVTNGPRRKQLGSQGRRLKSILSEPEIQVLDSHADHLYNSVADVLAPIQLVGPLHVTELALIMQKAYEADDSEALGQAHWNFMAAAEKVLRIDGGRS